MMVILDLFDLSTPGYFQYLASSHIQDLVVPYTLSRALRLSSAVFSMHISNFRKSRLMIAWMERMSVLTAPVELPYTTN